MSQKIDMDALFDAGLVDSIQELVLVADMPEEIWAVAYSHLSHGLLLLSRLNEASVTSSSSAYWWGVKDIAVNLHTVVCLVNKEHPVCDLLLDIIGSSVDQMIH